MLSFVSKSTPSLFSRFFCKEDMTQKLFEKVDKIVEERIRPMIKMDGGDITLEDIQDGVMVVSLTGACSHCPSKKGTLRNGVLECVQEEVPEIVGIREKLDFEDF
ncbi:NifU family protein [Histomonas meleagridis]|uniref:NifU family protein n=1 Tax=Histomonas meleagridis TaxID=135588 RepID=UPI00355975C0|nr:NifU family protein [Histomonas meleagridis]KAH0801860.1 NifU family protein [Histomonas meleagridis]